MDQELIPIATVVVVPLVGPTLFNKA